VHYGKEDPDAALKDFNEAIRLRPDFAWAYISRGLAHKDKEDLDAALKDYNEAIRLKPDFAEAYYNRGLVHYRKRDLYAAHKDYTEAIRLKPDYADAYVSPGLEYRDKAELDAALKNLLFSEGSLDQFLSDREGEAYGSVLDLDQARLLSSPIAEVVGQLVAEHMLTVPELKLDARSAFPPQEVSVEVYDHRGGSVFPVCRSL
jgi:tetratricopeptide (TPR) repeat protein